MPDEPQPQSGAVAYTTPTNTTDLRKMGTKRVLITGFGPFLHVEINPSWEGVNCMNREQIERKYNINFFQEKIDVVYSVDQSLPKLWAKLQPDLTIHVGVKGDIEHFLLETQAAKEKYQIRDAQDACPVDFKHSSDGPDTICTNLDVDILCQEFNSNPPAEGVTAKKSCEAGKYVCEYTYYTSLACCGRSKTLFVHVPHERFSYELIAQGLERILEVCLGQLED